MTTPPDPTRIYHITHVDNLPSILGDGGLYADSVMIPRGGPAVSIGMGSIKDDRLHQPMKCHPGDMVGEYVPFNFCPRSVMLNVIYYGNAYGLSYRGGQGPIVHLEADLRRVVAWADAEGRRWAFTLANARAKYAEFRIDLRQLDEIDWLAVAARDFRDSQVKEVKQAEFLVREFFPWSLVERLGVLSADIGARARRSLKGAGHRPDVVVMPDWYFPV